MPVDRERVVRALTFWLRPDFLVRCLRRFQALEGFDRAIALASLTFSALIPLGIVVSGALSDHDIGDHLVERFGLEGQGARAVTQLFDTGEDLASGFSIFSFFLLLVTILSFSRALQRLFERTWELPPLSVRNSKNGLIWISGLVVYAVITGSVRANYNAGVLELLTGAVLAFLSVAFVVWSGVLLSNRRITRRELLPAAILVAAVAALLAIGGDIYVPRLFNSYADRYGAVGAVFALISWLFVLMVGLVSAVAIGREVSLELDAIQRGEKPSSEQIQAEWAGVRRQAHNARQRVSEWRAARKQKG
jgi:membrane protein